MRGINNAREVYDHIDLSKRSGIVSTPTQPVNVIAIGRIENLHFSVRSTDFGASQLSREGG
jgi:hypothetical protein